MSTPPTSTPPTFATTKDELGVIVDFVRELKSTFGASDEKLCNYAEILSHLDRTMEEFNEVHKRIFIDFCWLNRVGIIARDLKLFRATILDYKTEVFEINFGKILQEADAESKLVIWRYLLTILAMSAEDVEVKADAKQQLLILKNPAAPPLSLPSEFLQGGMPPEFSQALSGIMGNMFQKLATNPHAQKIADCKDVGEAMGIMMQLGIIQDVMSAITGGDDAPPSELANSFLGSAAEDSLPPSPPVDALTPSRNRNRNRKKMKLDN
jgi:hypothetical protein